MEVLQQRVLKQVARSRLIGFVCRIVAGNERTHDMLVLGNKIKGKQYAQVFLR